MCDVLRIDCHRTEERERGDHLGEGGGETPPIVRRATSDVRPVNAKVLEQSAETFLDEQCGFRRHGSSFRAVTAVWSNGPILPPCAEQNSPSAVPSEADVANNCDELDELRRLTRRLHRSCRGTAAPTVEMSWVLSVSTGPHATELVGLKVDVIVAPSTQARSSPILE